VIPSFDHNLVIPPHIGNPTNSDQLSPYTTDTLALCQRFATSPERIAILRGFLAFRERLRNEGILNGVQWLDGSFLEDIEAREHRPPRDMDVVTFYWGYDYAFQQQVMTAFPEFVRSSLSKAAFLVDHFPVDSSFVPEIIEVTRYWTQLFSHNRLGVWKGMLSLQLNTAIIDQSALSYLNSLP
jgi:hypothetical protein